MSDGPTFVSLSIPQRYKGHTTWKKRQTSIREFSRYGLVSTALFLKICSDRLASENDKAMIRSLLKLHDLPEHCHNTPDDDPNGILLDLRFLGESVRKFFGQFLFLFDTPYQLFFPNWGKTTPTGHTLSYYEDLPSEPRLRQTSTMTKLMAADFLRFSPGKTVEPSVMYANSQVQFPRIFRVQKVINLFFSRPYSHSAAHRSRNRSRAGRRKKS